MTRTEKATLLVVWLAMIVAGTAFFLRQATSDGLAERVKLAAGLFVAIMSAVFSIGALAYASQKPGAGGSLVPDCYESALKSTLIQQAILLTLAALMLDGGGAFHVAVLAAAAYWPMVMIVVLRRADAPRKSDLLAIRYGFPLVWLATGILGGIVWSRMGRM